MKVERAMSTDWLERSLNRLGREGWELVNVFLAPPNDAVIDDPRFIATLKRPLAPPPHVKWPGKMLPSDKQY